MSFIGEGVVSFFLEKVYVKRGCFGVERWVGFGARSGCRWKGFVMGTWSSFLVWFFRWLVFGYYW